MNLKITPAPPQWGLTLAPGYCGFITREHDLVGDGIEYFEHFETGLPFVHTFIVESLNPQFSTINIIEAHASTGVARATLDEYLGQGESSSSSSSNNVQCFIRIPIGWTPETGRAIVAAAAAHLGERYAFLLILADALANTFLGHCLNQLTGNLPDRFFCWTLSNAHRKICSQLVALALQNQPPLRPYGCLRCPADTILPKELGNDPAIWEPVIYKF